MEPAENEYLALFGASELFAQLDQMEPRKPRRRQRKRPAREPVKEEYLSLFGASELFAQLDEMEPRKPRRRNRRRGTGRKRNQLVEDPENCTCHGAKAAEEPANSDCGCSEDSKSEKSVSTKSEDSSPCGGAKDPAPKEPAPKEPAPKKEPAKCSKLNGYSMNLYGAQDLFEQLQAENGLERKKWTPKHKRRDD